MQSYNIKRKIIFFTMFFAGIFLLPKISLAAAINAVSCGQVDVQAAINLAVNGDTIMIPDGSCAWSSGISTTKRIMIRAQNNTPTPGGNTSRSVTIINNSSIPLFSLTSGDDYHVGIAGIRFNEGTGNVNHIRLQGTGSKVPLINDNYFQVKSRSGNNPDIAALALLSQGGVMWNTYAAANVPDGVGNASIFVSSPRAWYTASTLGSLDTNGNVNWYFEDSTFFNIGQSPDIDNNGRVVVRYSTLDGVSGLTHGFTSPWGGRHFEYYNNVFSVTTENRNHVGRYFWARAGHGIFTDNVVNDSSYPGAYGHITLLDTICENCSSYPKSRQVGWGHDGNQDVIDPIYIWNNTGSQAYTWGTISPTYIQLNREIFVNSGPKPGYSKYTYPHPLRVDAPVPPSDTQSPSIPTNLSATAVSSSQINLSWTASSDDVGVTGYHLERCQGSSCSNFSQIATPNTNSYRDTGLPANTIYNYRVRATDSANLSGYSGTASATTQAPSPIITIGETNILSLDDSGNGNLFLAQSAFLSQAATVQSLSFYVTTAAGKLRLGIYDSTGPGGGPGQKKAETVEITPIVGWNTANVTSQVLLQTGTYWLAYLPQSSSLAFKRDGTGSFKMYSYTYGVMPQTFSTSPSSGVDHWSFYATLNTQIPQDITSPASPTGVQVQ